jgi:hypothetical protein
MSFRLSDKERATLAQANFSPTGVKRGDLVVTHAECSYQRGVDEYQVWIATSVTREGRVKSLRAAHHVGELNPYDVPLQRIIGLKSIGIVAKNRIDIDAAINAVREHVWPETRQPKPFDTLDEVRDVLRPHLCTAGH